MLIQGGALFALVISRSRDSLAVEVELNKALTGSWGCGSVDMGATVGHSTPICGRM